MVRRGQKPKKREKKKKKKKKTMKLAEYQASTAPKFQTTVTAIKSLKWFE
jgi:hypothetical protein